jgi:hypothetical protein
MPFEQNGQCFATALEAANHAATGHLNDFVAIGSSTYSVNVTGVTATQINYQLRALNSTAVINSVSPYTARPCGLYNWQDGVTLGWGVGLVFLAVFGLMFLTRGLRHPESSSYGNA